MQKILIAVFGRGTQMLSEGGDWATTEDLEVCDIKGHSFSHFPVRIAADDENENCVIGGGELSVAAGVEIYKASDPELIVFAYGNRSPYLKSNGYPSESQIMSEEFIAKIGGAEKLRVEIFSEETWNVEGSGTYQEIHNVLTRALRGNIAEIVLVTITVHMPRVLAMVAKHRRTKPEFKKVRIVPITSESILMQANNEFDERIWRMLGSRSMARNLHREANGMDALLRGVTQVTQLPVAVGA